MTKTVSVFELQRELPKMTLSHQDRTAAQMALKYSADGNGQIKLIDLPEPVQTALSAQSSDIDASTRR